MALLWKCIVEQALARGSGKVHVNEGPWGLMSVWKSNVFYRSNCSPPTIVTPRIYTKCYYPVDNVKITNLEAAAILPGNPEASVAHFHSSVKYLSTVSCLYFLRFRYEPFQAVVSVRSARTIHLPLEQNRMVLLTRLDRQDTVFFSSSSRHRVIPAQVFFTPDRGYS
jgi:hypothetical protein